MSERDEERAALRPIWDEVDREQAAADASCGIDAGDVFEAPGAHGGPRRFVVARVRHGIAEGVESYPGTDAASCELGHPVGTLKPEFGWTRVHDLKPVDNGASECRRCGASVLGAEVFHRDHYDASGRILALSVDCDEASREIVAHEAIPPSCCPARHASNAGMLSLQLEVTRRLAANPSVRMTVGTVLRDLRGRR